MSYGSRITDLPICDREPPLSRECSNLIRKGQFSSQLSILFRQ